MERAMFAAAGGVGVNERWIWNGRRGVACGELQDCVDTGETALAYEVADVVLGRGVGVLDDGGRLFTSSAMLAWTHGSAVGQLKNRFCGERVVKVARNWCTDARAARPGVSS